MKSTDCGTKIRCGRRLGIFAFVVSASLVILSLTGIYLWFKIHEERLVGAVLLRHSASANSLTVMVLLWTA